jgi:large subunit ribosomal protein L22
MTKTENVGTAHVASARSTNLPISTKHSVEISHHLRYKTTSSAKEFLESVVEMKQAVPFRRYARDVGHRRGMSAGRYPVKAVKEFISLIKSVESNAQEKGLNTSSLKISKLIANKASSPMTGGRRRGASKRTHLQIEVIEGVTKKSPKKDTKKKVKSEVPKSTVPAKEEVKVEEKVAEPINEEAPEVESKVEAVAEPEAKPAEESVEKPVEKVEEAVPAETKSTDNNQEEKSNESEKPEESQ